MYVPHDEKMYGRGAQISNLPENVPLATLPVIAFLHQLHLTHCNYNLEFLCTE